MTTPAELRAAALEKDPSTPIHFASGDWRNRGVDQLGLRDPGCARRFPGSELRAQPQLVDFHGKQRIQLDGVASTTDQPYRMWDAFGEYDEVIDRAAFGETLARLPDVGFLVNHGGVTMARSSGEAPSLELSVGETGLTARAYVNPDRRDVADLVHAIRDGEITEMSFAFRIDDGEWSEDFTQFRISKVNLDRGDVSAVNFGANPFTSIGVRTADVIEDIEHLSAAAAGEAMRRLSAKLGPTARSFIDLGAPELVQNNRGELTNAHPITVTVDTPAAVLPASALIPPVQGLKPEERSDLGRSVHLARLQFLIDEDDD